MPRYIHLLSKQGQSILVFKFRRYTNMCQRKTHHSPGYDQEPLRPFLRTSSFFHSPSMQGKAPTSARPALSPGNRSLCWRFLRLVGWKVTWQRGQGLVRILYLTAKGVALTSASPSLAGMGTHTQGAGRWTGLPIVGSRNRGAALRKLLAYFRFFYLPTPFNGTSTRHTLPTMLSHLPPFLLLRWTLLTLKILLSLLSTLSWSLISLVSSLLGPLHFLFFLK